MLLLNLFALCAPATPPADAVRQALQSVANVIATKYNASVALAYHAPDVSSSTIVAAAGYTDAGLTLGTPSRPAQPDDIYVWGSTTKMFTATAVLRLVDAGNIALSDSVASLVDPFLVAANGTRLAASLGAAIEKVTIAELLHMTSSIGDYDGSKYTQDQFADFAHDFSPIEIISGYVPRLSPSAKPGTSQRYCSTNYILLGMVLAAQDWASKGGGEADWRAYDQKSAVLPTAVLRRTLLRGSTFVDAGRCSAFTPVHGFLQSYSSAHIPSQDVWNVSCVGGWTAGNYLGPVADVAAFTYELYRPSSLLLSAAAQAHLTNFSAPGKDPSHKFYGMGTFSLDWAIGTDGEEAYGHVGDTYGAQSQNTYFPSLGSALAVGTNVETSSQAQPAEATCLAYHAVVAALKGVAPPKCTFTVPQHFIGTCTCEDY